MERDQIREVVVEANTWLQQVAAIHGFVVAEAIIVSKVLVERWLVTRCVPVITQTRDNVQLVADLPLVLSVERIDFVTERSRTVVDIVRARRVFITEVSKVAVCEIFDGIKDPLTQRFLNEQVKDFELFTLVTNREGVVVPEVVRSRFVVPEVVRKLVRVTRVVCTEVNSRTAIQTNLDFTEVVEAQDWVLTVCQVDVRNPDVCREVIGPV